MTDPQFRDLTRPARGGVLLALAAGLRVVEWSQAIRDFFHLVEYLVIGLVDGIIGRAVAPVVESGGCLRRGARNRDLNRWCGRTHTARRQRERHGGEPHRGAREPDVNHANLTRQGVEKEPDDDYVVCFVLRFLCLSLCCATNSHPSKRTAAQYR